MILEFIKRVWLSYVISLSAFSAIVAAVFTIASGDDSASHIGSLLLGILMMAVPVTLLIAMPVVFWGWSIQQRKGITLSRVGAGSIGLLAGAFLHTLMLMCFGFWAELPKILIFTVLCGGSCGFIFNLIFANLGGFKLTGLAEQCGVERPLSAS